MAKEQSFRATWSVGLEEYGYTQISNKFLDLAPALEISSEETLFIIHCFRFKWDVDQPYPSLKTIAHKMGKNRNTIQRYARSLEKKGYIRRVLRAYQPSKIDLQPLIKLIEYLAPHSDLDIGGLQKCKEVYLTMNTKKDPLRKYI